MEAKVLLNWPRVNSEAGRSFTCSFMQLEWTFNQSCKNKNGLICSTFALNVSKKKIGFRRLIWHERNLAKIGLSTAIPELIKCKCYFLWTCGRALEGGMWLSGGRDSAAFNLRLNSSSYWSVCTGGSAEITALFRVATVSVRQEADATMLCNKVFGVRKPVIIKSISSAAAGSLITFQVWNVCVLLTWTVSLLIRSSVRYCKASKKAHDLAGPSLYLHITGTKKNKNRTHGLTCCSEELKSSTDIRADKHVS